MKTRLAILMSLVLVCAMAQQHRAEAPRANQARPNAARANQGHIPAPPQKREMGAKPEEERTPTGHVNNMPHVRNDKWYGHDAPNDARFKLSRPFEHGRFEHIGPSYRYSVTRFDPNLHRFWLPGGFYFEIAAWDWPLAMDWYWNCGDDFVIYDDVDHPGWYLLYNIHTGAYVHVQYMGM